MGTGFTDAERAASQRELDQLGRRVDQMDAQGTRGVGVIQLQVAELVKDVTELRAETQAWQRSHISQHQREEQARVTGRRWVIGTVIAAMAVMVAMLALLVSISGRIR